MVRKSKKNRVITSEEKQETDLQIKEMQKQIDYDTKDFTIELLVDKFNKGDFFIPPYQRGFVWLPRNKTLFIESIFLGLPIPFMFFGNCADGRMEIIDGAQRIQTIVEFKNNKMQISGLKKLTKLNGLYFKDLSEAQQRKFLNKSLRIIVLEETTPINARQDLFYRINTSGLKANDSEIRRGSYPGRLTTFIENCSADEDFVKLSPMSVTRVKRHERFEFVLRFFAYLNEYQDFDHEVNIFLDDYLIRNLEDFNEEQFKKEFETMVAFIKKHFPFGFAKSENAKATPRVRFEAISVGVALALREKPDLSPQNINWINSDEFKEHTTSDASNNEGKLKARVEYVRDQLLKG
ncbi:DUF262 domain-containing protein [Dehalobacter sp. TeCB1]|uniref:DUF262 domain-containing protein n=1 Tax=Dehalobacter sp. TeCB1 TaxID=1843715 RepID=UPI00083B6590|nr:DUF262 domain-containing protein [Dehalobacter sp. TeCB1]OCZ49911.1 hypothetical protein A7D23_00765 [Dehalobacter sp. TeCB1]